MTQTHVKGVRALAQALGISKTRVGQLLQEERLPRPGPNGYDVALARAAYEATVDADWSARQKVNARKAVDTKRTKQLPQTGDASKATAALMVAKARIAKLRLDVAAGTMIDAEIAAGHLSAAVGSAKQRLLQLEPSLTPYLLSTKTSADLRETIHATPRRLQERANATQQ